jgi:hypothetical protein
MLGWEGSDIDGGTESWGRPIEEVALIWRQGKDTRRAGFAQRQCQVRLRATSLLHPPCLRYDEVGDEVDIYCSVEGMGPKGDALLRGWECRAWAFVGVTMSEIGSRGNTDSETAEN